MHARFLRAAAGLVLLLSLQAAYAAGRPADEARQILAATGVQGGLILHLSCGDGRLTAALRANDSYLVQGLDADPKSVDAARKQVQAAGLYGKVCIDRLAGRRIPFIDNLANLVVCDGPLPVPMAEVMRVLCPNGVAYVREGGKWVKSIKPRPKEIDEWTHYLYDAAGNAVSHDQVVGSPRRMQWVSGPTWARHHDHMASMSCMVSSNGRVFYIIDEGPTASIRLPSKWALVARDAFNGTLLWKRPIPTWNTQLWPLKSGPGQIPRRLVAVGDRVYATLALDSPVVALDAATGKTLRTYNPTRYAEEILCSEGVLFVISNQAPSKWAQYRQTNTYVWDSTSRANKDWAWDEKPRSIVAVEAGSGKLLWQRTAKVAPLAFSADHNRVCYHDGERIVSLDRKTGKVQWTSDPVSRRPIIPVSFGPTLVLYKDVVLFSGGDRKMWALSAADGKTLWNSYHPRSGHMSPEDLLVVGGLAWAGEIANGSDSGVFRGRDVHTGEVKAEFPPDVSTYWFHHRCYRSKATDRYLLTSRTGIEVIDPTTKHWDPNHWVRGGCIYGIMPCNGMIYVPPQACGCYLESKLNGLNALAPAAAAPVVTPPDEERLEKGPAYSTNLPPAPSDPSDWTTYRHDPARSGATPVAVAAQMGRAWQANLGGRLSALTAAGGKVFVAAIDTHTVYALDQESGKTVWSFTAGGRVDSPPTIWQGRALFGSADGWVYCLRADDGRLAWRFRVAPEDSRTVSYEQPESLWPVSGAVLVQNDVVYAVAGRSMFLDGGMRLVRLDPKTGRKLSETILDDRDPATGKNLQSLVKGLVMPVALPDILSSDGKRVYMRSQQFDLEGKRLSVAPGDIADQEGEEAHLFCQTGFLDDTTFHRSYWEFGKSVGGGYGQWFTTGRFAPSGRLLAFNGDTIYGYGRKPEYYCNTSVIESEIFAADKQPSNAAIKALRAGERQINQRSDKNGADSSDWKLRELFDRSKLSAVRYKWTDDQPSFQARAMVLAGKTLFLAGYPDVIDERESLRKPDDPQVKAKLAEQEAAVEGKLGGRLWAVSTADGKPAARYDLDAPPVFDGMAAAGGRLFIADTRGQVLCLAGDGSGGLKRADSEPLEVVWPDEAKEQPAGLRPPEVSKEGDFTRVVAASVVESKMGYRVRGEARQQAAIAVRKLPAPLTRQVTIKGKLNVRPNGQLINGFLVFGDAGRDDQLVKCGFRLRGKTAMIIQGPLFGGKTSATKQVEIATGQTVDVTLTVDLAKQTVTMSTLGQTLQAPLQRRLQSVTFVGYCVDNAVVDFTPLDVQGE